MTQAMEEEPTLDEIVPYLVSFIQHLLNFSSIFQCYISSYITCFWNVKDLITGKHDRCEAMNKNIEYQDMEPSIVNLKVKWKQLFKGEVRCPHTATHAKVPPCGPVW